MITNKKFIIITVSLFLCAGILSGCSIQLGGGSGGTDGGAWASTNQGDTWQQRVTVPSAKGSPRSIAALDGLALAMDPSDNKAIYFGSVDNGLFYTYNMTSEWQMASSLGQVTVSDIAVDQDERCTVYVAVANRVYKTTDCTRSWSQAYYDNDLQVSINTIAVDSYNSKNVFIGTSRGEVIKSLDKGVSWQTVGRFDESVKKIIISPQDSRIILAATKNEGVYKSTDNGANWKSLKEALKDFNTNSTFRDISFTKADAGVVYLATNYGLLKSLNYGENWTKIDLITPEEKAIINAIAVSPKSSKEIYYVTNTTFYRSVDGGDNWTTRKLPTTRAGWHILINPLNTKIIYLSTKTIKK